VGRADGRIGTHRFRAQPNFRKSGTPEALVAEKEPATHSGEQERTKAPGLLEGPMPMQFGQRRWEVGLSAAVGTYSRLIYVHPNNMMITRSMHFFSELLVDFPALWSGTRPRAFAEQARRCHPAEQGRRQ
jgi:hypothetical protein